MNTDRWVFTFGYDHVHPETGQSLANHYIVLLGDVNETRRYMNDFFDRKWAMQYPNEEAAGVEEYGLKPLGYIGERND